MRDDPDVVLTAVQQEGVLLEFASARLKNDRGVVRAAVQQAGHALSAMSQTCRPGYTRPTAIIKRCSPMHSRAGFASSRAP